MTLDDPCPKISDLPGLYPKPGALDHTAVDSADVPVTMSTQVSNAQIATRSSSVRRSHRRSRRAMVCVSAATPGSANRTSVAAEIVGAILKFPPLWEAASKGAKEKMVKRAGELGIEWEAEVNQLRSAADWEQALKDATDPEVVENTPAYYKTSFHAYPEGNLGWDPALEVEVAAKAVHAPVFSEDGKTLEKDGDEKLRAGYHRAQAEAMDFIDPDMRKKAKKVVDVGCSSGLSTRALVGAFPDAEQFVGIDLSNYFIAVANHALGARAGDPNGYDRSKVRFQHGAGENLPFENDSQDLVSSCLTFHELPASAAQDVIREAYRVLKPGGCMSMMDMDPTAPAFQRIANNVFAFTAFKSTEPYLEQYAALDVQEVMRRAGFETVETRSSSPRHRTIVARKPAAAK